MEYPESITEFLSGKMTEEAFISKLRDSNHVLFKKLTSDHLLYAKCLLKLRDPGNRRSLLMKSLPINREDLEELLQSGSSLVTDLKRPSNRKFKSEVIAKFGIIYRVTFSWGSRQYPAEGWDYHNFDHLEESLLSSRKDLTELLSPRSDKQWTINGYQLKLTGTNSIYLRLDRREDLIILDLMNPSLENLDIIIEILSKTAYQWWFQQMPSLVIGHSFYIFFGAKDKRLVEKVVKDELPLIKDAFKLSAIYGGK